MEIPNARTTPTQTICEFFEYSCKIDFENFSVSVISWEKEEGDRW